MDRKEGEHLLGGAGPALVKAMVFLRNGGEETERQGVVRERSSTREQKC